MVDKKQKKQLEKLAIERLKKLPVKLLKSFAEMPPELLNHLLSQPPEIEKLDFVSKKIPKKEFVSNEKIIEAFYRYKAIKTHIARALQITPDTLNKWLDKYPELKTAYETSLEYSIDWVESKQNELINGVLVQEYTQFGYKVYKRPPCYKSINNYLGAKAKHRGYGKQDKNSILEDTEFMKFLDRELRPELNN